MKSQRVNNSCESLGSKEKELKVSCEFCVGTFFKQKLGRCKQCIGINLILLIGAISLYSYLDISKWLAVQQVTLLMFIGASTILMVLHIAAWCFYWLKGNNKA